MKTLLLLMPRIIAAKSIQTKFCTSTRWVQTQLGLSTQKLSFGGLHHHSLACISAEHGLVTDTDTHTEADTES